MSPREMREKLRIALVDDEPDFRTILKTWLRPAYEPVAYDSAEELLADQSAAPDLIITDVRMPGLSGYLLCEALKAHPRLGKVPILFLTGVDSDEGYLLGMEAGAAAYLTKPVDRPRLMERVRELLERRPAKTLR